MKTKTEISQSAPEIVMSRTYLAPRELVWQVITQPEHVTHWWGGSEFTNPVCEMDLRPGGTWRHVMRARDGYEIHMDFVFVKVEQPRLLMWKQDAPDIVFTVTLEEKGRHTNWKLVAEFSSFQERDTSLAMGYTGPIEASSERLAAHLKEIQ